MNKKQLVAKLAGSLNQSKADAERTFDTCLLYTSDAADDMPVCRSRWSPYH